MCVRIPLARSQKWKLLGIQLLNMNGVSIGTPFFFYGYKEGMDV